MINHIKRIFVFLIPVFITSQNNEGSVSGTVYGNQEPLVGANIILDKTMMGSTTDLEGNYSINI